MGKKHFRKRNRIKINVDLQNIIIGIALILGGLWLHSYATSLFSNAFMSGMGDPFSASRNSSLYTYASYALIILGGYLVIKEFLGK